MKNTIFAAIATLALAVPATLRADEPAKEYNMVITLQNGTTITLGHNDIKNITFNGEEISISGNVVNTIEKLTKESQDQYTLIEDNRYSIKELTSMIDELKYTIDKNIGYTNDNLNELENQLKAYATLKYVDDRLANLSSGSTGDPAAIDELKMKIADLESRIDYNYETFKKAIADTQTDTYTLYERIQANEEDIHYIKKNVDDLYMNEMESKDRIAELENYARYLEDLIMKVKDQLGL